MSKLVPGNTVFGKNQLGRKDAFHAPCVLVSSDQYIDRGDRLKFVGPNKVVRDWENPQGVADPFLSTILIVPGEVFWMFLLPDQVEDLTHQFSIKGQPAPNPPQPPQVVERLYPYDDEEFYGKDESCSHIRF